MWIYKDTYVIITNDLQKTNKARFILPIKK